MSATLKGLLGGLLGGAVAFGLLLLLGGSPTAPRTFQTAVYGDTGGDRLVVASGGEIQVESGGTVDLQSGSTANFDGTVTGAVSNDLDGGLFTLDADADTTLRAQTDDVISVTLGAAAGILKVLTGNLQVGNGTPGVTLNGEDGYIEGTFEVDGAAQFDGAVSATSTLGVTGRHTASGGLTATSGGTLILGSASITPTNGVAFAIAAPHVLLTPAGAVTPTITIPAAGVQACIHNNTTNAVLIVDTGNQVLAGNVTLGQYDVICVRSDGTRVIEYSRTNN